MRISAYQPWHTLIEPTEGDTVAPNGVRIKLAFPSKPMRMAAARAARKTLDRLGFDGDALSGRDLSEDELVAVFEASDEASRALIRLGALKDANPEWEGLVDADDKPVPLNAETLEWALNDDAFFEAADRLYVQPASARDREKNGSPASPNGIGEAATPASDIASSPATRRGKGGARDAHTGRTPRKPKRAKASGTS